MDAGYFFVILRLVLGEYAWDFGSWLPNPAVLVPRMFPIILGNSVVLARFTKNEETWYRALGDFLSQKLFNPESIRRVVSWMALCTLLQNPNGNRNVLYLYRQDDGSWNWNYNWVDNDNWNASNPSAVLATLSISLRSTCPESFVSLIAPASRRASGQFLLAPLIRR